jgi:hypothetical protein
MLTLFLALTVVAALASVGMLAVRRRGTRTTSLDLWPHLSASRSLMARQRRLAEGLPSDRRNVIRLPVGPGADGARAARRLLDRSEAA